MVNKFNAFEIFEIAEGMERNAQAFYRRAASFFDEQAISQLLHKLADWEKKHEEMFAKMRRDVTESVNLLGNFDPDRYMPANPQILDGFALMVFKGSPTDEITGGETKEEILRKALQKERDTIVFFRGLQRYARDFTGKYSISDIIREEEHHVRIIEQSLEKA